MLITFGACNKKANEAITNTVNTIAVNKAITRKYLEEIINHQRLDLMKEVFTDNIEIKDGKETKHIENLEKFLKYLFTAFPDINYTIEELIAEGNKVVIKAGIKATHKGEFWGYQPLGNTLNIREILIFTMENGKIKTHGGFPDRFQMEKQLKVSK
jgi:steroid delta-isomerase-like uncharacterized protein